MRRSRSRSRDARQTAARIDVERYARTARTKADVAWRAGEALAAIWVLIPIDGAP